MSAQPVGFSDLCVLVSSDCDSKCGLLSIALISLSILEIRKLIYSKNKKKKREKTLKNEETAE